MVLVVCKIDKPRAMIEITSAAVMSEDWASTLRACESATELNATPTIAKTNDANEKHPINAIGNASIPRTSPATPNPIPVFGLKNCYPYNKHLIFNKFNKYFAA
jgi:hypothetical protein